MSRISSGAGWNLLMSIVCDAQPRPAGVEALTEPQGRKIWRRSVATTRPVTGGYRSPIGDDQVGDLADRLAVWSRTGRPMTWLR